MVYLISDAAHVCQAPKMNRKCPIEYWRFVRLKWKKMNWVTSSQKYFLAYW